MGLDFRNLPRCGAKLRSRDGATCRQVAMTNGRCYLHGGKSTGPRTKEGLERMQQSKTKHGYYSKARIEERKYFRLKLRNMRTNPTVGYSASPEYAFVTNRNLYRLRR
jgi:hypothetical protein